MCNERTDVGHDSVELGLVSRSEENIKARSGQLNRKLATDAV